MLRKTLSRLQGEEDGFTLIELMVVVMILGILIVMGLPTYIGVRARFQDRAAQTDLRNAVLSARILYTDNATFVNATSAPGTGLVSIVPNMCYVGGNGRDEVGRHRDRRVRERGRERLDQRQRHHLAVHGRPPVRVAVLLRDPRCHDRHEVRQDHGGQLLRGLGYGRDRHGHDARGRRLVAGSYLLLGIFAAEELRRLSFSSSETAALSTAESVGAPEGASPSEARS